MKNNKLISLILLFKILAVPQVHASSPLTPFSYFCGSGDGTPFCLQVIPNKNSEEADISCNEIDQDGRTSMLWTAKVKYPFPGEIYLCRNGKSMAQITPPTSILTSEEFDKWILLLFYDQGKVIAKIKLSEVVDVTKLTGHSVMARDYYTVVHKGYGFPGIQVFPGYSSFVSGLKLSPEKKIKNNDDILIIHTTQHRSIAFRFSTGAFVSSWKTSDLFFE